MNSTAQPQASGQKPLVMVIDDNPEFLSGIELTLQMEGFEVWTANDGQNALDQLDKAVQIQQNMEGMGDIGRLPDLILADIMMPIMDGYELYDNLQNNPYTNNIPFIFLTAKGSDENIREGKALGVDDYLPKLSAPEDILASIRGKLKRVQQKRSLAARFLGDANTPPMGGFYIAVAVIGALLLVAFCLGIVIAIGFNS